MYSFLKAFLVLIKKICSLKNQEGPHSTLSLTLWCPAAFGNFQEKITETYVALCRDFSSLVSVNDLVKVSKDAASLVAYTRKKFFWLGVADFL